jgi:DNA-binding NtrC family response regulator
MRLTVKDLPARTNQTKEPVYQLAYKAGSKSLGVPLGEGEIIIGASSGCDIRIQAPGVRSRHARLKRNKDKVFIQPVGKSNILLDNRVIDGLTPLRNSQTFTFGSVAAKVECLFPADLSPAVHVKPVSIKTIPEDHGVEVADQAVRQLSLLNNTLEEFIRAGKAMGCEPLLEALHQCLAPIASALFKRKIKEDWIPLAQITMAGAPSVLDPENSGGYTRFTMLVEDFEFLLLVLLSHDTNLPWQEEICRHILLLATMRDDRTNKQKVIGPSKGPSLPSSKDKDVWHEFVGNRVRTYMDTCTEICRGSDMVLVLGETGTGKELAARGLHRLWKRKGEFVALNCAAIPEDLLDAELFGIEAGTATGVSGRKGRIEQARHGTLFLDEISELPLRLQAKLLRVLQERDYFKVGGAKLQEADVHIVAASNHTDEYLRSDKLRRDLYFRLSQAIISLPPLRERTEDLAALCEFFLNQLENQFGRGITGLSLSVLNRLKSHSWPGNLRELQNLLRYLYANTPEGGLIQAILLPDDLQPKPQIPPKGTLTNIVKDVELQVIEKELKRHKTVADAAKSLGLSEGYLYRKIKKLGLKGI